MIFKTLFSILVLSALLVGTSYSQSLINFEVNTDKLVPGELVELTGKVEAGLEGQPVAVEVKDSDGNVILIRTVESDSNGNFILKFIVPETASVGEMDIVTNVELDGQSFSDEQILESVAVEPQPEDDSICGAGTVMKDGVCVVDTSKQQEPEKESSRGGGCLIATATFDSELAPQVQKLREIRDSKLLQTESGSAFMEHFNSFYYSFSPVIADYERENPVFKEMVKMGVTPLLTTLSLMDYAESESEVLGIGIGVILLNLGMYVGVPVFAIMRIRR
jgi:hypothetical protein